LTTIEINTIKAKLIGSLRSRFEYLLNSDLTDMFISITFLDFRFKNFKFTNSTVLINEYKKRAYDFLSQICISKLYLETTQVNEAVVLQYHRTNWLKSLEVSLKACLIHKRYICIHKTLNSKKSSKLIWPLNTIKLIMIP